ncbi:5,6-dimethylbenzimidazole synthase [Streptomyces sp. NPDC099088]|uniref:5,6-dimethylbenzimidazole synthase n=1 Tax=Streptomyces sp. NPDC099088 TaxID=3366101 RepID=UPI00380F2131
MTYDFVLQYSERRLPHEDLEVNTPEGSEAPKFTREFQRDFDDLLRWRRDVRHFDTAAIDTEVLDRLLDAACMAPSVGNAQPWRFVSVDDAANRAAIAANFTKANSDALAGYSGDRAQRYAGLKLAGLHDAPHQFAVFCDSRTKQGHGLGRSTMPEMLQYSAVLAVHTFWLQARAHGIGVGWVSILDPEAVTRQLAVPDEWKLVAYLCIGRPLHESATPELERRGWQSRSTDCRRVLQR